MIAERVIGHHLDETARIAADTIDVSTALGAMALHHTTFVLTHEEHASAWQGCITDASPDQAWRLRRLWRLYVQEWVNAVAAARPDLGDGEARAAVHAALALLASPIRYKSGLSDERLTKLLTSMALGALASAAPPIGPAPASDGPANGPDVLAVPTDLASRRR